ncbi:MAG: DUF4352 domain-containing protein [Acidimicrobiales bacterium]
MERGRGLSFAAIMLVALVFAGCTTASSGSTTSATLVPSTSSTTTMSATTTTIQPWWVSHVGGSWTLAIAGDNVTVGLLGVIDPARSEIPAGAGYRYVAVKITVTNNASSAFTDDMNNDVTVVGSDGKTYTASMHPLNGCTHFDLGRVALSKGASSVGCVGFRLPDGTTATQMGFRPEAAYAGTAPYVWDL